MTMADETEVPEVFTMPPVPTAQVCGRVRSVRQAPFVWIDDNKDVMPPCLLFYPGFGFSGWIVRAWTRSRFAHVAVCEGGVVYNAFGRRRLSCRPYNSALDNDAVRIPIVPAAPTGWLEAQVGKPYDIWSIVLCGLCKRAPQWLHVYVSRQGVWTCSRLACVWAGYEAKAWGLRWPPTPEDDYEFATAKP